ncbi:FliI/YscN family ATPase [Haliangium sp. UPWRP_2]|uniref:FliI/YscN family ATPase n=1 Tax=Haliangium sp. UPWRP_2 TaxID=1931276 RepID=UPI000B53995A|nr:FliI/YscN family ATPase [Haliangium sp. UPWRP_2]PSM31134.1 FliI/YscN family ATPase [Haliangium sp. UPWRP_2]
MDPREPSLDPLRLDDALQTLSRTVPQRIAGRVTELTGLVLRATAPGARVGELVEIERQGDSPAREPGADSGLLAEVVGFRGEEVVLLPLGSAHGIGPASIVRPLGRPFTIQVGAALLGRVLDAYGVPIDGGPSQASLLPELLPCPVEREAPEPLRRRRITEALPLGLRAIDGCLTVGQGQRLGLFSGPGIGKTTLLGQIARNTAADVTVIGLIGERGREVRDFLDTQLDPAARKRTVVVCATSDQPPLLRIKAALSATTIAEHFRDRGKRVLLLMDSLTRIARAQREVGLAAGELPARQGYPPSVFALLPRLLERTGQAEFGSITAVYAVLVTGTAEDTDDIIAEEVRATLDGHIELSRDLAERGYHPAIDILRSLSRLMDDLVDAPHRRAASRLREVLAIAARQRDLLLLGAYQRGSDPATDAALDRVPAIEAFLRQERGDRSDPTDTRTRLLSLF